MDDTRRAESPAPIGWLLAAAGERAATAFRSMLPDGIHPRQFAVLQVVSQATSTLSQAEVARGLGIPPSRIVGIVDHLEEGGYLTRHADAHDRRTRRLTITADGSRLLQDLESVTREADRAAVGPLTDTEREQLRHLLSRIVGDPHIW